MQELRFVDANGVRFAYFEEGTGPLILLVHGFPDTPHSWAPVMRACAEGGYRAVAPFTRGYFPSSVPPDKKYDAETLGADVLALIEALGERSAILVGHDFGASATLAASQIDPSKVQLLVTVGVPHPASILPLPRIAWGTRHFGTFKMPWGVNALAKNDFALIETLMKRWSPAWTFGPEEMRAVKESFAREGSAEAAVAYYGPISPLMSEVLRRKIEVPTVAFSGDTDSVMKRVDFERAQKYHASSYEIISMPGGHFMHREDPQLFNAHLLAVLRRSQSARPTSAADASVH